MAVQFDYLNVQHGEKRQILVPDPDDEKERDKLAKHVVKLRDDGFLVFVEYEVGGKKESGQIKDYDKEKHQWILSIETRVPAEKSKVTVVPKMSGG